MIGIALLLADMGWGNHMDDWGAGWWIAMALGMVLFWGLVIVGVVWLVRSVPWRADQRGAGPIEILDRRLAAGEISADDYRERREILEGKPQQQHS
jgi:putative membrane protein